jgi:hypothetical protein
MQKFKLLILSLLIGANLQAWDGPLDYLYYGMTGGLAKLPSQIAEDRRKHRGPAQRMQDESKQLLKEDTVHVDNNIQADTTTAVDVPIKTLFDTAKINNNKPQQLAISLPAKISEKPKPIVPTKKSAAETESTIQAIGYGNSENEALKSAYQNAVEQYVGVLVDSSTIIRNDQLIKNDILTFSNGYIESYKKLSSKEQMGLWEVKIDAVIKKQNVLEKIKALNIDPIDIKDSEQTYAKLVTQVNSKFDAEDMLVKAVRETVKKQSLERYTYLRVDSVDVDLDRATRKFVPIVINYSILFNWEEYHKITDRFEKLFGRIGGNLISTKEFISADSVTQGLERDGVSIIILFKKNNKIYANTWLFPKSFGVIYPFQSSYHGWTFYKKDQEDVKVYQPHYYKDMLMDSTPYSFSLHMINADKKAIWSDTIKAWQIKDLFAKSNGILFIAPLSFDSSNSVIYKGVKKIEMDIDKLKDLKQVKISWDK